MADRRRVLIVDDSATECSVIDKILRSCGFGEIEALHDGEAALERMRAARFDIVICDWEMAAMSGSDMLNRARQLASARNTQFILMSAKKDMDWIVAAKKAGAGGLIAKPFTADTLKHKIDQLTLVH